jgi:hypothetical protein
VNRYRYSLHGALWCYTSTSGFRSSFRCGFTCGLGCGFATGAQPHGCHIGHVKVLKVKAPRGREPLKAKVTIWNCEIRIT